MAEEPRIEHWKALGIRTWTLIGILLLVAAAVRALGAVWPALVPFLMAAVVVSLLRGPVARLEHSGVPRWVSVLVWYVVTLAVLTLAGLFIFPVLASQLTQFINAFPTYYGQASKTVLDLTSRYWDTAPEWARQAATNLESTATAEVGRWATSLANGVVAAGGSVVTFLFDGLLALFIAFYLLVDLPTIRRELLLVAGQRRRRDAEVILGQISKVVGGFLRGQVIIAVANGLMTAVGLAIVGVPYSGVIGFITGLLSVIPYVGPIIASVIVAITGLFVGVWTAVLGVVVMVVVQQIEGTLLSPRIMSREVDLHPALVIFSLLAGAELAGLVGMLVAIPVAATAKALFVHYFEQNTEGDLATEDGALFRHPKAEAPSGKKPRAGGTGRADK